MQQSYNSSKIFVIVWCLVLGTVWGCEGLNPANVPPITEFRGTVTYVGGEASWPADSVYDLRVVMFDSIPTSTTAVLGAILSGSAAFSNTLPSPAISTQYAIQINPAPRTFRYVVVALRNGPSPLTDWLMLSVYAPTGNVNQPGTVSILTGETATINFTVDFDQLPPQPFK
ncbi:MAG: hypothetical protein HQ472_00230 [Ignavibacteria bacterium]|nr:hypothetical protein [Ignavibacteria bacterium]